MPQLLLLFVLALAGYVQAPASPPVDPWLGAGLALLSVLAVCLTAELPAALLTRRIWYHRAGRYRQVRLYHRLRLAHALFAAIVFLALLFQARWDSVVRDVWGLRDAQVVSLALLILPYLAGQLLSFAAFYRVELALHQTASSAFLHHPFWSRGEYVLFQARQSCGLVLSAALLFLSLQEIATRLFPDLSEESWQFLALHGAVALIVVLVMPWLLTVVWPTRSLGPGPIRHQLDEAAKRLRFRCTDIRLWDTGGCLANAMVTGLLPAPRYVLLSDLLVDSLHPEEIEAVFGHEMGHVRHHHLPLFMAFLTLSAALFASAGQPLLDWLAIRWTWTPVLPFAGTLAVGYWLAHGLVLALAGGCLFVVFGQLSRLCERQADVFGCKAVQAPPSVAAEARTVSANGSGHFRLTTHPVDEPPQAGTLQPHGIRVFIAALQKVASLNGIDPQRFSWRHGSIARRIAFLETLLLDAAAEPRFQRHALFFKLGLLLTLIGLIGLCWWKLGAVAIL